MDKIKCIYCGKEFEISEALRKHIKDEELIKYKREVENEIARSKERAEKAEENELKIRKEKEVFEEEKRRFTLEKQRQLDAERESIRIKARNEKSEEDKLKFAEYEKRLSDMGRALEEAKRKGSQGSQQLQGEVQELDLEETLRKLFPTDAIEGIKKGELGADVRQIIRSQLGRVCGKILWESKRTKTWSDGWISKLKEDVRRDRAHGGAIISEVLPTEFNKEIGQINGVWVTNPRFVDVLANFLRKNLYDVAREKAISVNKQSKAEELYDYVTGHEFTQQVERMVEIYFQMREQISKERASAERQFKQREMQVERLLTGVSGIIGSMQGIAGSAMHQIKQLQSGEEK